MAHGEFCRRRTGNFDARACVSVMLPPLSPLPRFRGHLITLMLDGSSIFLSQCCECAHVRVRIPCAAFASAHRKGAPTSF